VSITETTLTANMPLKEMLDRKLQWKTVDDETVTTSSLSYDADPQKIVLEGQRIRQF